MTKEQIELVTKGNPAATDFVATYVSHCHLLDDLFDRDQACDDERLIASETAWLLQLCGNPWFIQHRNYLVPLIVSGFNAWLDSNRFAQAGEAMGELESQIAADVLKGYYHEVVWAAAFLCGGMSHYREVTGKFRQFDFEKRPILPGAGRRCENNEPSIAGMKREGK